MASTVQVTFGANIQPLVDGVNGAKATLEGFAQAAKTLFAGYAVHEVADFVGQYAAMGEQIEKTAATFGVSTTAEQELGYISQQTGGSQESLAEAVNRLQVNLQTALNPTSRQALALNAMGLSAKQLLAVPVPEQLGLIAAAAKRMVDDGLNPASLIIEVMGRGAAGMVPYLEQGRAGLEALRQKAIDTGAIMSGEVVADLARLDTATDGMKASMTAAAGSIVGELAPALTRLENELATSAGSFTALAESGNLSSYTMAVLQRGAEMAVAQLGKVATALVDMATGRWGETFAADMAKANAIIDATAKQTVSDLDARLQAAKESYRGLIQEADKASGLKPVSVGSTDAMRGAAEQYAALASAAEKAYDEAKTLDDSSFSQIKEHLAAELGQHEITYGQETDGLIAALNQRLAAETAALGQRYAAEYQAFTGEMAQYGEGTSQWQAALNKRTAAYATYQADLAKLDAQWSSQHQKIVDDAAKHDEQQWKAAADTAAGAFNSQLLKMLQGKEDFAQASKTIEADLLLDFMKNQIKATAEYLADLARRFAAHVATEMGMTSASTAGAATRAAADTASGQQSILADIANALKAIFSGAGQTVAGVSAAVAPEAGPAAPAIGAAAGASVLATAEGYLSGFDLGTDYVMRGGLAMIHAGEQIVPARGSGPYTGANAGGSFSMGDMHIHPPAGQPVDGGQIARDFISTMRRKGVFGGNRYRMA